MEERQCLQTGEEKLVVSKSRRDSKRFRDRMEGPDGGYAWLVALASCLINLITSGLSRMSGILFVAFIEIFQVDRRSASMPLSVRSSARNLFGPVVGILGQKYGPRMMIITGGVIATISAALCFFFSDILSITILWGVMNGLGASLSSTLPQVVIGQYFIKYSTTASGMGFSGGCIGAFLFPVLVEYLLYHYGIEGTFLLLAGVIMHVIPAAIILRKPPWLKNERLRHPEIYQNPAQSLNQSLDHLVWTESDSIKNCTIVSAHSINQSTSNTFISKSSEEKPLVIVSSGKMKLTQNGNGCAPEKNLSEIPKQISDVTINMEFLRQNSGIVTKLLSSKWSENGGIATSEVNQNELNYETECAILETIESLYNLKLTAKEESQIYKNVHLMKSNSLQVELLDKSKSFTNFNLQKKISESELPKLHSMPSIFETDDNFSRTFLLNKLSELKSVNEKLILENFPGDKSKATLVLTELMKLNDLYPANDNKISNSSEASKNVRGNFSETLETEYHSNSFVEHIKTALNLHANPLFLMVCFCRAVHFITFVPMTTIVVDFSIDKGFQEADGIYVIAALSVGDLLGRLCLGWITDRGFVSLQKYMMIVMVLQGTCTITLPMMYSRIVLFSGLALFGMLQGSLFVRHPVLISKYMRNHEQSIAMGCANFLSGLLGFGFPLYLGYFRDNLGSYDYIFYINGTIGICIGLLWVFEPFFIRYVNEKRTTQKIPV